MYVTVCINVCMYVICVYVCMYACMYGAVNGRCVFLKGNLFLAKQQKPGTFCCIHISTARAAEKWFFFVKILADFATRPGHLRLISCYERRPLMRRMTLNLIFQLSSTNKSKKKPKKNRNQIKTSTQSESINYQTNSKNQSRYQNK